MPTDLTATAATPVTSTQAVPHRLEKLLSPKSIALVGASDRSGWSNYIHHALTVYGYAGHAYYVNPRGGTAHGQQLWTSLDALPEVPDLVFVMVPAAVVPSVIEKAARLGVPAAEILSSGFAEEGEEGRRLQDQVASIARSAGMAVLGPNNLGFVNVHDAIGLSPMADADALPAGSVAMISQSGNLAGQIQTLARSFDVGLSMVVSTGNEVDVTAGDVVDYLVDHDPTRAIGVFLETVRRPDDFVDACRRARQAGKVVVVLKAGRSDAAARSALAHTGALVGDDAVIGAALEAAGVIRVDTLEDLIAVADVHTRVGEIRGRRIGVVSISGGAGDIASDLAEPLGLELPDVTESTKTTLRDILPSYGTPQNPLDMTGVVIAQPEIFGLGLRTVAEDSQFDLALAVTEAEHMAKDLDDPMLSGLLQAAKSSTTPTLIATTTVHPVSARTAALRRTADLPTVSWGLDRVLSSVSALASWAARDISTSPDLESAIEFEDLGDRRGAWSEGRARQLLERAGVPVIPAVVVRPGDAIPEIDGTHFAVKILSDDIAHKSDVGGVRLNVPAHELGQTVQRVVDTVAQRAPTASIDGVLISPMRSGGVELLVGVVRDDQWGCVLAIALGGIWTEIMGDVQRVALPASRKSIGAALDKLRAAPLLHGARGTEPVDIDALVDAISRISDLAITLGPDLAALEVNPLRADKTSVEALDAVVIWND